jgi:hypothetical protein
LALPPLTSIPPPRVGLSSIRIPSSAGGGVTVRAGVGVPNEKVGFDTSEEIGAGVPNEKFPVLAAGLVSDCDAGAGEPNKSPVGALAGDVEVEEPNVNMLLAGVEGAAVAVCLTG